MGLSIGVGLIPYLRREDPEGLVWLRAELVEVNRVLRCNGLPPHEEPEDLPLLRSRSTGVGQPYGMLHYLRRAVAHALRGQQQLTPLAPGEDDPTTDDNYDAVLFSFSSHVICHSDCEGFYVPIDFPEPLYDDLPDSDPHCIAGGILGSSQGAMRELVAVAPLIGIELENGDLSERQIEQLNREEPDEHPFSTERYVWFRFYEAARMSVQYTTAIVFG
jgi:hypothetical protein